MKSLLASLLASAAASAAFGALAELNIAEGTVQTADGRFSGRDFKIVNGFKMELLYQTTPATEGQWVALDWDSKGRLIVPSYNSDRMARLTIPVVGSNAPVQVEMITTAPVAAAEGVLNAFGGLYFNANRSTTMRSGLYKMTDTNGDDKYDTTRVLHNLQASGDHGTHTLRLTPDGQRISMISGNATRVTEFTRSRIPEIWGEDNLILRFTTGGRAPQAYITYFSPDGTDRELYYAGMRNPVSQAYNADGEMFVYDADHEPDMGFAPGYRPTNLLHAISGGDHGWRSTSRVHPFYYFDYYGMLAVVGSGSPTGGIFGTGAKFPARYQTAYFLCDYSFGNLWAAIMTPSGSSYKAEITPFISGRPFATSGAIVNPADGSLLVMTTGTQLYRITYTGNESTARLGPDTTFAAAREQRRSLEAFHGRPDPRALNAAWNFLGSPDKATRYAARTAVEWQPVNTWRDRALDEADPRKATAAVLALARASGPDEYFISPARPANRDKVLQNRMFAALDRIDWNQLGYQEKLDLLRAYQLVMIRLGMPDDAATQRLIAKFDPLLPAKQKELNWELSEILIYLQAPSAATKVMALLRNAPSPSYWGIQEWPNPQQRQRGEPGTMGPAGISQVRIERQEDQMHYAQLLRVLTAGWTPELRKEYLTYFVDGTATYAGTLTGLQTIRVDAISRLSESEKTTYKALIDAPMNLGVGRGGLGANLPVPFAPPAGFNLVSNARGTPGIGAPAAPLFVPPANTLNDIQLTKVTRFDESIAKELKAFNDASAELLQATFTNSAAIQAKVDAVAQAELALAMVRANGFPKLKADLALPADRVSYLVSAVMQRGGGRLTAPPAPRATPAAPAPRGN